MERLINKDVDLKMLSPLSLAFIGDCIYELFVREQLICDGNYPANKLHKKSVEKVCCKAQADNAEKILPILTEEELDAFKRGRNAHTNNIPKNATYAQYHKATGLETLFGYLYLKGDLLRLKELFSLL